MRATYMRATVLGAPGRVPKYVVTERAGPPTIMIPGRPTCINHNCNEPVKQKGGSLKKPETITGWRVHCSHCAEASYGEHPHRPGVIPFKTGQCSNQDGHLGFTCSINYKKHPHFIGMTEVDHKNGDHTDNRHSNLDELCPLCHELKSQRNGDKRQRRTGERKRTK